MKTVQTFFLAFPALNSTAMIKKLKYSNSYLITTQTNIIRNPSIVTIGSMKTVKTFFFTFPALNSTTMNKKLKYSNSYLIKQDFSLHFSLRYFQFFLVAVVVRAESRVADGKFGTEIDLSLMCG